MYLGAQLLLKLVHDGNFFIFMDLNAQNKKSFVPV